MYVVRPARDDACDARRAAASCVLMVVFALAILFAAHFVLTRVTEDQVVRAITSLSVSPKHVFTEFFRREQGMARPHIGADGLQIRRP